MHRCGADIDTVVVEQITNMGEGGLTEPEEVTVYVCPDCDRILKFQDAHP